MDGLVLYAPWVDVTMMNPAITDVQRLDKILRVPGLAWAGRAWAGDLDPGRSACQPLYDVFRTAANAHLPGAPTSWVPTRLSLRARQLAPAWTCACAWSRGGFHVYVLSVPFIPEAVAALDRSARFVTGILRSR